MNIERIILRPNELDTPLVIITFPYLPMKRLLFMALPVYFQTHGEKRSASFPVKAGHVDEGTTFWN